MNYCITRCSPIDKFILHDFYFVSRKHKRKFFRKIIEMAELLCIFLNDVLKMNIEEEKRLNVPNNFIFFIW